MCWSRKIAIAWCNQMLLISTGVEVDFIASILVKSKGKGKVTLFNEGNT